MDTSLILKSIDPSGEVLRKVFTYVNPEVSNSNLKEFALKANSLTDNIFQAAFRIIKINVDEEWQSGTQKPTPSLVFGMDAVSLKGGDQVAINYSYNGDAKFLYSYADPDVINYKLDLANQRIVLTAPDAVSATKKYLFRVYSPQTTHYADKEYFFSYSLIEGQAEPAQDFTTQDIDYIFTDGEVKGGFTEDNVGYIFNDDLPVETGFSAADILYIFGEESAEPTESDIDYIFTDGEVKGGFAPANLNYVFDDSSPAENVLTSADIDYIFN